MNLVLNLVWGSTIRKAASIVAAVFGAMVAVTTAWSSWDLPVPAMRAWVAEKIRPVQMAQADTTKAVWQLQLQSLQSSLYAAKTDQQKAPSPTVDQRIQDLEQQIEQTKAKINGR